MDIFTTNSTKLSSFRKQTFQYINLRYKYSREKYRDSNVVQFPLYPKFTFFVRVSKFQNFQSNVSKKCCKQTIIAVFLTFLRWKYQSFFPRNLYFIEARFELDTSHARIQYLYKSGFQIATNQVTENIQMLDEYSSHELNV